MNAFLQFLADIFKAAPKYNNVEAYIAAGNPQTPEDVDRLEREFNSIYRAHSQFNRYY